MGLKTIPFREIEERAENMYEAVAAMYGQARNELQERVLSRAILEHQNDDERIFADTCSSPPHHPHQPGPAHRLRVRSDGLSRERPGVCAWSGDGSAAAARAAAPPAARGRRCGRARAPGAARSGSGGAA